MFQTEPAGRGARTVEKVVNQKVRVSKYKTWAFKKLVLSSWSLSRISSQISGVERKVVIEAEPCSERQKRPSHVLFSPYQTFLCYFLFVAQTRT